MPENTLICHRCGERKPRTGFKLLASRHVSICPECWPQVEPYLENLRDFRARLDEQAARFVVGLLRKSAQAGVAPPPPNVVAEQIDGMVTGAG